MINIDFNSFMVGTYKDKTIMFCNICEEHLHVDVKFWSLQQLIDKANDHIKQVAKHG